MKEYLKQQDIIKQIGNAINNKKGFSFVRVGDGELVLLAQEIVLSQKEIMSKYWWSKNSLSYCGTSLPNIKLRDLMIKAIKNADIVGMFEESIYEERFNPACMDVAKFNTIVFDKLQFFPEQICYAFENVYLPMNYEFIKLIIDYPPLIIGGEATKFIEFLNKRLKLNIQQSVSIKDYSELDDCIKAISKIDFQWALVSAGVNALPICDYIKSINKVSVDFGHAPDYVMYPNIYTNFKYKFLKDDLS